MEIKYEKEKFVNGVSMGTPSKRINDFNSMARAMTFVYEQMEDDEREKVTDSIEMVSNLNPTN